MSKPPTSSSTSTGFLLKPFSLKSAPKSKVETTHKASGQWDYEQPAKTAQCGMAITLIRVCIAAMIVDPPVPAIPPDLKLKHTHTKTNKREKKRKGHTRQKELRTKSVAKLPQLQLRLHLLQLPARRLVARLHAQHLERSREAGASRPRALVLGGRVLWGALPKPRLRTENKKP